MANMMKPRDNTGLYKSKVAELEKAKLTEVDQRDVGTPDEWIKRHPDMVRLTGRHPFNVEPPLPKLMEHGFITPASLHYVRNHGNIVPAGTGGFSSSATPCALTRSGRLSSVPQAPCRTSTSRLLASRLAASSARQKYSQWTTSTKCRHARSL